DIKTEKSKLRLQDYYEFLKVLPSGYWVRAFNYDLLKQYRLEAKSKYKDVISLNKAYAETLDSYEYLLFPVDEPAIRSWTPATESKKWQDYLEFKAKLPVSHRLPLPLRKKYVDYLKLNCYLQIEKLNSEWGAGYAGFEQINLPSSLPKNKKEAERWTIFVKTKMPYRFIKLTGGRAQYIAFLKNKYASISNLNRYYKTACKGWEQVVFPETEPAQSGQLKLDWRTYCETSAPITAISVFDAEQKYYEFLRNKYNNSIEELNRVYGTQYAGFDSAEIPFKEADYSYFSERKMALRFAFITNNYTDVLNYMLLNGRATVNTVILVLAMLLTSLTVNPLCAYALSRYNLKYSYKILLFLLATMAFPAEVGMIPGFLLLKQLGFLNTFWALILPAMASGYNIFILKGFFDSLPRELYESADLDGANERQMFWHITLPLSKPVFAVIALWTFVATYGGFMWAFIICQDPKMWTIMVSLYQFQQASGASGQHLVMAALTFAALPVLLVFVFAQKIIMKGIILPVEK
ncbi:MAG: carbohydrate ABC transporter permease, partial [Candidatus Firestonebacteria bacterium]